MDRFNLKFKGEILPGRDPVEVKRLFAREFYIENPKRVEAFFSGQEIMLRRNLLKDDAARVFVALRQIGVVTHIEKIEPAPGEQERAAPTPPAVPTPAETTPVSAPTTAARAAPATAAKTPATESPAAKTPAAAARVTAIRRKRQPGAPNMFELRHSDRSTPFAKRLENSAMLIRAPMIAAAIALLAFLLVGVRFWSQNHAQAEQGLGLVVVDPRQQPLIQSGDQLLLHDRAGLSTYRMPLADLGVKHAMALDFFGNGDLMLLRVPPASTLPGWLTDPVGKDTQEGNHLLRCVLKQRSCSTLASGVGAADFVVDRRNNEIYLADAGANLLRKLDASGQVLASKPLELTAPLHLRLQEGILYLTQSSSDSVLILKPDESDFGLQLDQVALAVSDASQTGHIFPADLLFLNERWWTIMQSRDGSTAGLYLFTPRWQFDRSVPLPGDSLPTALTLWANKVLVTDSALELLYRFDAAARQERDFSSEFLDLSLSEHHSQLSLAESLQAFVLVILFGAAAGLLALGILQSLRGKIYTHPEDNADAEFDINNEAIEWLDPAPEVEKRLQLLGYAVAGGAVILLLAAFLAQLSIWSLVAIILLLAGVGGLYYALLRASGCHLGLLEERLILVDHTNTYRVGSGPNIQYFKNYVMIDDVIVYLGNPVLEQFAHEPLVQRFQPLFSTGIKVDRATLRIKLIQSRHPMVLGVGGLACALFCAAVLILLS